MTSLRGAFIAAAVVRLVLGASSADARVLCSKASGKVFARETCRKKETPLDAAQLVAGAPKGPVGPPGAPGAPGAVPIRVTDAIGREVGPIVDVTDAAYLALAPPGEETPVVVLIEPAGFFESTRFGDNEFVQLFYPSTDCSGDPSMSIGYQHGLYAYALVIGTTVSYPAGASRDVAVRLAEHGPAAGACPGMTPTDRGTCCEGGLPGTTRMLDPARRLAFADIPFTPPFSAALR